MFRRFVLAALLFVTLPAGALAQQITVSAAASLTDAFKEIGAKFEAARPGTTVRFNFAASGVLLQQIGQGAPVDVLATADEETMDRATLQKLVDTATRRDFASNSVVLVVPAQGGPAVTSLADLAGPQVKRIAIGKTATVPVGRYTKQLLEAAGLWTALEPKFVRADSVRQVLDYVARGEVEAGFVYRTDAALMADKVRVVLLPAFAPAGQAAVRYPVAVVGESRNALLAREFAAYLAAPAAQSVLARFGFAPP